jgi:hypothetical protein
MPQPREQIQIPRCGCSSIPRLGGQGGHHGAAGGLEAGLIPEFALITRWVAVQRKEV